MKRHNNLFDQIVSYENLELAYQRAKKGKSKKISVIKFSQNVEGNLLKIQESLVSKSFTTSHYTTKMVHEPKERLIHVLPFAPDRIVQHAIMNFLEPIWDKLLIFDSYACRVGKGIHKGSRRTMEFVRRYKYCLKCDISKFYPTINHDILYKIICKKVRCKDTLALLKNIVYSTDGVPIGNYTSQWFGNLYLNELDFFVKQTHRIKAYIRYCDDFLLFHDDRSYLRELSIKMQDFVWTNLRLVLSKCDLFPVSRGVDFLGYRHFKDCILLRKSTVKRVKKRLGNLPNQLHKGNQLFDSCVSSIASTLGWMQHGNCFNLQQRMGVI